MRQISNYMKLKLLLSITLATVLFSCTQESVNQPIFDRAYALFSDGEYEMSEEYLKNHESDLKQPLSDADSVYLTLLKSLYKGKFTLLDWKSLDTTRLNHCIDFYRKTSDSEKLAWSLYLKSVKNLFSGDYAKAVVVLRQAEDVAKTLTNNELKFHIAYWRFTADGSTFDLGERGMGLVEKMRPYARSTDQKAHYLDAKISIFYLNGMIDSAKYYVRESEKIDTANYGFLCDYALVFAEEESEKSLRYSLKASEINPWNDGAKIARIKSYLWLNRLQDAIDFYQNSAFIGDGNRFLVTEDFFHYYHRHGMSAEADRTAAELIQLYHNILQGITESSRVYSASTNYDFDLLRLANQNRTQRIVFALVLGFAALIALLTVVFVRQRRRYERELAQNRQILKESHDKIEELRTAGESADNEREIARLQRKINEIESRYAEIYSQGKQLYEEIFARGGNSGQWNKRDYERFLEYYKTLDLSLLAQIEEEYNSLNPRQTFFKILQAKGFEKEQIMLAMGIMEDGTFRALKSKVEGQKK